MKSFFRSSIIVALGTLISRISGLARELLLAWFFGATITADALNVAFKLPNLFRRIFAEGALSVVFIPIFNSFNDKKTQQEFVNQTFVWLLIILIIFIALFEYFMPQIIIAVAPGLSIENNIFILTVFLCRITIIYLIFVSICALIGGILNSLNQFGAFAFNQVILNLVIIIFTVTMNYFKLFDIAYIFCFGLLFGGVMQVVFMCKMMQRTEITFSWPQTLQSFELKTLMIRIVPALGSAGIMQINLFISQIIASFIVGAISVLNYAERVYQFPLSILGITFSTVLLPALSKLHKSDLIEKSYDIQNKVIKLSLILSLPCTIGIMIFAPEFINLIYERGAFDFIATQKVAGVLFWFSLGLPAFILVKIFSTILYAKGQTFYAFKITSYSMVVNIILNILLMRTLGENGIALGSSIAAWIHFLLLLYTTCKNNYYKAKIEFGYWIKVIGLNFLVSIILLIIKQNLILYYYDWGILKKIISIVVIIIATMLVYFISAIKLKITDLDFASIRN